MKTQENHTPPSLVVRRVIRAKRDRVFQAWTDPNKMKDWFFCGEGRANVSNELKVGGSYRNEMIMEPSPDHGNACGGPGGKNVQVHTGEYIEILPPERVVFTWSSSIVKNSRVTVEFRDLGDATEVVITHDRLETEELRRLHTLGWEGCLGNLEKFLK